MSEKTKGRGSVVKATVTSNAGFAAKKTRLQPKSYSRASSHIDEIEKSLIVMNARKMYITAAMNMGWQLALTVLVPVFVGVKLDEAFKTTPSYTLAALVLAVGGASMVVWKTVKQANRNQLGVKGKNK